MVPAFSGPELTKGAVFSARRMEESHQIENCRMKEFGFVDDLCLDEYDSVDSI